MSIKKSYQSGFTVIEVVIAIMVVLAIGFAAWVAFSKSDRSVPLLGGANGFKEWSFNGEVWKAPLSPPSCENPLVIGAPMDMKKATSKLYPGQVRGTDFKPHGGLSVDNATSTNLEVFAVRDAYLYQGSRYIENGVEQYLLDFMDPCGVMYRYDHLAVLSDELMKYARQLPEAKQDDSRTTKFQSHPLVKKGVVVATAVGKSGNVGFDLGVYDLRKPNDASVTEIYKTDSRRISDKEQSFYAVCWFELLPDAEKTIVKALPSRSNGEEGTSSDYCETDSNTTFQK